MRRIVGIVVGVSLVAMGFASGSAAAAENDDPWGAGRVLNVAHAGGDLEAPHSTLYAMKTAVLAGTDVLEMDVRLSADGVLMVHHDTTVDRTTADSGQMRDFTAAELQAMDNAYWFTPNCWSCHGLPAQDYLLRGIRTGDRLPPDGYSASDFAIATLEEVAETFPGRLLDVEIKDGPDGFAAAEALAAFIAAHGPADRYLVASFDDAIMAHFKSLAPDVATSPGLDETTAWFLTRGPMPDHRVLQVPPTYSGIDVVTEQFVADAHANGLAVWVWFNGNDDDSPAVWQHLIDIGVDALLTGKPAAAQAVIDDNDAGFAVAPVVDSSAEVRGRHATIEVACPALHVATCASRMIVVAQDRRGRWVIVADHEVAVGRGLDVAQEVDLTRDGRRLFRGGSLDAVALMFATDDDTAHAIAVVELHRR